MCCLISTFFVNFPVFLLLLICCGCFVFPHCGQKGYFYNFNFLHLSRFVLWSNMWSILEKVLCALEKKVNFSVLGWNVLLGTFSSAHSVMNYKGELWHLPTQTAVCCGGSIWAPWLAELRSVLPGVSLEKLGCWTCQSILFLPWRSQECKVSFIS